MNTRAPGHPPVIILGRRAELIDAFVTAFGQRGVTALHGDTAVEQADDAADSIVLILDEAPNDSLFAGRLAASKRRARLSHNAVCEATLAVALRTGPRRLLVVCDARHLSFGQRIRAISWIRRLLHRVGYECSINGLQHLTTRYAVLDNADDLIRTADRAAAWHCGHPVDGPAGAVSLSPCRP